MNQLPEYKIATITINHQHDRMIKDTINSLMALRDQVPFQAFVINNLKDTGTTSWLQKTYPETIVLENPSPEGFAANINTIIKGYPDFDFYFLLNPDAICLPGLLTNLLQVMQQDHQVGIAGPLLMNMDGSPQPSRRRFVTLPVLILRALHIDSLFKHINAVDKYLMRDATFTDKVAVDWITGAVMLLRKEALDEIGLFDERFYMYFEDEDLCCRMWQSGWKVVYVPQAKAYHAHLAEGRKKILSRANLHHITSAARMMLKYHGKITNCSKK